jgi:hypothetical protein
MRRNYINDFITGEDIFDNLHMYSEEVGYAPKKDIHIGRYGKIAGAALLATTILFGGYKVYEKHKEKKASQYESRIEFDV